MYFFNNHLQDLLVFHYSFYYPLYTFSKQESFYLFVSHFIFTFELAKKVAQGLGHKRVLVIPQWHSKPLQETRVELDCVLDHRLDFLVGRSCFFRF